MRKTKRALTIAIILILMAGIAGCAQMQSGVHDLNGSIIGNEYNIDIFDNSGIRTVSFSEIESPSLLVRRGSLSLLRGRKSNLVRIQQARHPSRRIRWWRSAS